MVSCMVFHCSAIWMIEVFVQRLFAKRAIYQRGEWLLEDVRETLFSEGVSSRVSEPYRVWETSLSPSLLSILIVKPDNLSISGLYRYVEYLQKQNLNASCVHDIVLEESLTAIVHLSSCFCSYLFCIWPFALSYHGVSNFLWFGCGLGV